MAALFSVAIVTFLAAAGGLRSAQEVEAMGCKADIDSCHSGGSAEVDTIAAQVVPLLTQAGAGDQIKKLACDHKEAYKCGLQSDACQSKIGQLAHFGLPNSEAALDAACR